MASSSALTDLAHAFLGRSEPRDLVDLLFLDRAGHRAISMLETAKRKDAGMTPAMLAWAIEQVPVHRLPEGLLVPLSPGELETCALDLRSRLERLAYPA